MRTRSTKYEVDALYRIFGVLSDPQTIRRKFKDSIGFASLLARRRILFEWKSPFAPRASLWLKDLILYLDLEKIKYNLRGTPVWGCIISYIIKLQDNWNAHLWQLTCHHISFPSLPHSNSLTMLLLCILLFSVYLFICLSAYSKKGRMCTTSHLFWSVTRSCRTGRGEEGISGCCFWKGKSC